MSPLHQQESRLTTSSGPQSQPGSLDQVLLPWRGRPLPCISSAVKKHGRIFARLLELNLCALRVAGFLEAVYFFGSLGVLLVPLGDRLLIKERLEMKEPVSFHAPVPLHRAECLTWSLCTRGTWVRTVKSNSHVLSCRVMAEVDTGGALFSRELQSFPSEGFVGCSHWTHCSTDPRPCFLGIHITTSWDCSVSDSKGI